MGILEGRVAIVTGGARGVGRGLSLALAKEGASIVLAEIDPETGPATEKELHALGAKARFVQCDVGQRDQVEHTVAETVAEFGGIDILINCATGARPATAFRSFLEHTDEQIELQLSVEVWGSFYFMQTCHPHLCKSPAARIINICSLAGTERSPGFMIYGAAKEALRAMSGVAAKEWGPDGINVNVICPTASTEATQRFLKENPKQTKAAIGSLPLRRFGDPELDIGRVAVFLSGPDSAFMTGQTLFVDGGAVIHA